MEGDKDTNNSMNNSHVLSDHSVSHISHESDNDAAEALNDQLFWAATFDRCTSGNKITVEDCDSEVPTNPTLTPLTSSEKTNFQHSNPEFYKTIASKLAPSCNSSLLDQPSEFCGSKPSLVTASTTADAEMFETPSACSANNNNLINIKLGKRKLSESISGVNG